MFRACSCAGGVANSALLFKRVLEGATSTHGWSTSWLRFVYGRRNRRSRHGLYGRSSSCMRCNIVQRLLNSLPNHRLDLSQLHERCLIKWLRFGSVSRFQFPQAGSYSRCRAVKLVLLWVHWRCYSSLHAVAVGRLVNFATMI